MAVRVVGFDGDDTLWHSETRFHVTQGEFRELLARHIPDADVDARLAQMEMKNLAIYGYGVKSFTLSMLETAIELTKAQIPATDLEVILGWGKRMLMEPTELLAGVEKTLRGLSERYDLLLINKGDLFDQACCLELKRPFVTPCCTEPKETKMRKHTWGGSIRLPDSRPCGRPPQRWPNALCGRPAE